MGMSLSLRSWLNSISQSSKLPPQLGAGEGVLLTAEPVARVGRGF